MCDSRIILIVKIYNKNVIIGNRKYNIPPKVLNSNVHYDTYVDNISEPQQFVKNNEKSYHIIGYIKPKINRRTSLMNRSMFFKPVKRLDIKISVLFKNNTEHDIHICFIKPNVRKELHEITFQDYKIINKVPLKPKNTYPLISFVNHKFICGFFLDNGDFINISYFKLDKTRKEFIIE